MDRFHEAEIFVAIIKAGSITRAASNLGLDKSVVSRRLSALEARLKVKLLHRSTRGLTPTDAGQIFHRRATALIDDWREMEDVAAGDQRALSGGIRLAAPLSFGLSHLAPVLMAFARKFPEIRLDVDFSDRKTDLIGEGFDLAIRGGRLGDSDLRMRSLGSADMIVAASPDWISRHEPIETPAQLSDKGELRYSLRSGTGWTYKAPDGATGSFRMNEVMRASNGDYLRDAAISGLGVTIQPDFILCDAIRDGRLIRLLPGYQLQGPPLSIVYPPNRHQSARVRALIDHLVQSLTDEPWRLNEA